MQILEQGHVLDSQIAFLEWEAAKSIRVLIEEHQGYICCYGCPMEYFMTYAIMCPVANMIVLKVDVLAVPGL